jgi:putative transcriptional regulator
MKNRIATIRKELGITQEQLADKTGVTRQTIIALEQNRYNPSLGLAYAVKLALKKKTVEEVFEMEK